MRPESRRVFDRHRSLAQKGFEGQRETLIKEVQKLVAAAKRQLTVIDKRMVQHASVITSLEKAVSQDKTPGFNSIFLQDLMYAREYTHIKQEMAADQTIINNGSKTQQKRKQAQVRIELNENRLKSLPDPDSLGKHLIDLTKESWFKQWADKHDELLKLR